MEKKRDILEEIGSYIEVMGNKRDVVGRYEDDKLIIDTCRDPVGGQFETGVVDPRYYTTWIIVETYEDCGAAEGGHNRWIKLLTENPPPAELRDVDLYGIGLDPYLLKDA